MTTDFHATGPYGISIFQVIFTTYRAMRRSKNWWKKLIKGCDKDFYHRWMIIYIFIFFSKRSRLKDECRNDRSHDPMNETKKIEIGVWLFNWQRHIFVPSSCILRINSMYLEHPLTFHINFSALPPKSSFSLPLWILLHVWRNLSWDSTIQQIK